MTMDIPHLSDESIKKFAEYELDFINIACTLFQDFDKNNPDLFPVHSEQIAAQFAEFFHKRFGDDVGVEDRVSFFDWILCKCLTLQAELYLPGNILQEFIAEGFLFTQMLENTSLFDQSVLDKIVEAADEQAQE